MKVQHTAKALRAALKNNCYNVYLHRTECPTVAERVTSAKADTATGEVLIRTIPPL